MLCVFLCFFFNDTATTEIYTLSLPRRSSDLKLASPSIPSSSYSRCQVRIVSSSSSKTLATAAQLIPSSNKTSALARRARRSEEHTSELQSRQYLVCRLLLEKKKKEHNSLTMS